MQNHVSWLATLYPTKYSKSDFIHWFIGFQQKVMVPAEIAYTENDFSDFFLKSNLRRKFQKSIKIWKKSDFDG